MVCLQHRCDKGCRCMELISNSGGSRSKLDVRSSTLEQTNDGQHQRKPLSVAFNPEGELIVHSVMPEGISVATGTHGRCIVATKAFPRGSIVYRGYAGLVDTSTKNDRFYLYLYDHLDHKQAESRSPGHTFASQPMHVFRLDGLNSVKDYCEPNKSVRQVYGFDGLMNHSCNPNVYCPLVYRIKDEMCYDTIALRDIRPGEELTCDYACFDYECDGHEIAQCGCKAPNCRGEMKGFKCLSLEEKIRIMPMCEPEIVDTFFQENPNMTLLESMVPCQNIRLEVACGQTYIVAAKTFAKGDLIFSNQATIISVRTFMDQTFILKLVEKDATDEKNNVKTRYVILDKDHHFIHRPSYVESIGYDSFMDHCCNPNSEQHYENATTYSVYARRDIRVGEKITCDYLNLANEAEKLENVAKTTFLCNCGSENCRSEIFA